MKTVKFWSRILITIDKIEYYISKFDMCDVSNFSDKYVLKFILAF